MQTAGEAILCAASSAIDPDCMAKEIKQKE